MSNPLIVFFSPDSFGKSCIFVGSSKFVPCATAGDAASEWNGAALNAKLLPTNSRRLTTVGVGIFRSFVDQATAWSVNFTSTVAGWTAADYVPGVIPSCA
jgi:hypothetical protein